MGLVFHGTQQVGEIVAAFPGASNLFKAYGIDFCCGGGRILGEILRQRGIPEQSFLEKLQMAFDEAQRRRESTETDWREAPFTDLINRIVKVHHAYLRQELPLLEQFVTKISVVHGAGHPELETLSRLFHELKAELEPHLVAEETELFPWIQAFEQSGAWEALAFAIKAIDELETEHQVAGQLLFAMREATKDYLLPSDACRTYTLAFQKIQDLESDLFAHIHLENNILFPRLRRAAEAER